MSVLRASASVLRELAAPTGWTAALLEAQYPVESQGKEGYVAAVAELRTELDRLAELDLPTEKPHRELFLHLERCRPDVEIQVLQSHARRWMPEFGMAVWLDRDVPTTWTAEEFAEAAPGTLRPVMERALRLTRDRRPQEDAWRLLAGSGALIGVTTLRTGRFLQGATDYLQPRMTDASLTSFPFYLPLLTAEAITSPAAAWRAPLEDLLPEVGVYLRESPEDGGLLLAVRREPARFWNELSHKSFAALQVQRGAQPAGQ